MPSNDIPSDDLFYELFPDEQSAVHYLYQKGVFDNDQNCPACMRPMTVYIERELWRCTNRRCQRSLSIRHKSFFANSKLSCRKILNIARKWLNGDSTNSIVSSTAVSRPSVTSFLSYLREVVADSLEVEDYTIGGEGIIVEIDETKISKRKYNRGHRVEGAWVLGGVERTEERKLFLVEVPDRTANTLLPILRRHIRPGSIIYSDMFRSYFNIQTELDMQHETVNHSIEFARDINLTDLNEAPQITRIHTNSIEGTWAALKISIPKRNRTKNIEEHLFEFIWRRRHSGELWDALIIAMKLASYD